MNPVETLWNRIEFDRHAATRGSLLCTAALNGMRLRFPASHPQRDFAVHAATGALVRVSEETRSADVRMLAKAYLVCVNVSRARAGGSPGDLALPRFIREGWKQEWFDNSRDVRLAIGRFRKTCENSKAAKCEDALKIAVRKMRRANASPLWAIDAMGSTSVWKGQIPRLIDVVFDEYRPFWRKHFKRELGAASGNPST